eukprot:6888201-Prymnesium_polylepis.2
MARERRRRACPGRASLPDRAGQPQPRRCRWTCASAAQLWLPCLLHIGSPLARRVAHDAAAVVVSPDRRS